MGPGGWNRGLDNDPRAQDHELVGDLPAGSVRGHSFDWCHALRLLAAKCTRSKRPLWRQSRGKWMVSLVNSHPNATRIGWHVREID